MLLEHYTKCWNTKGAAG